MRYFYDSPERDDERDRDARLELLACLGELRILLDRLGRVEHELRGRARYDLSLAMAEARGAIPLLVLALAEVPPEGASRVLVTPGPLRHLSGVKEGLSARDPVDEGPDPGIIEGDAKGETARAREGSDFHDKVAQ